MSDPKIEYDKAMERIREDEIEIKKARWFITWTNWTLIILFPLALLANIIF